MSVVMVTVQGALFPAMHAILGQWAPPLERSFLGSMVVAGWFAHNFVLVLVSVLMLFSC